MFVGIDIGTSAVKAIVVNDEGLILEEANHALSSSHPGPLMSEQDPQAWWDATDASMQALKAWAPEVRAIGLSGQMHGAVLLDKQANPLRPAILWNDGRSGAECSALEETSPVRTITGNAAMPGFTAPKLMWVAKHEPTLFKATAKVLLPKDYIRLRMTGEYASDMSDAAGTLWLDTAKRCWSQTMLEATGLTLDHMPVLYEGTQVTGTLQPSIAKRWGMNEVPVVGGGGDQAAGAIGAGAIERGQASLSLGTSGVIFAPDSTYQANPDEGVHTFCHAIPNVWHQMAVTLSAAGSLAWITQQLGYTSEADLMEDLDATPAKDSSLMFLPYLSGERTPHNDPSAKGCFLGLTLNSDRKALAWAVLEGVAFALRDCRDVLHNAGADLSSLSLIGGGTRSLLWGQLIANVIEHELILREDATVGPALGAARLAMLGTTDQPLDEVCRPANVIQLIHPDSSQRESIDRKYQLYRECYQNLAQLFPSFD